MSERQISEKLGLTYCCSGKSCELSADESVGQCIMSRLRTCSVVVETILRGRCQDDGKNEQVAFRDARTLPGCTCSKISFPGLFTSPILAATLFRLIYNGTEALAIGAFTKENQQKN